MSQSVHDGMSAAGLARGGTRRPGHSPEDTLTRCRRVLGMRTCVGTVARVSRGGGNRATAKTPASWGLSAGAIGEPSAHADTQQSVGPADVLWSRVVRRLRR